MKKILLFIALMITAISANAQFTLTPDGLVSSENPDKKYIVLEFSDKSKQELYSAVNVYLHSLYVSPQDVVSTVNNEAITINGINDYAIYIGKKKRKVYNIKYTIAIAFKDGKIRINAPYIVNIVSSGNEFYVLGLGYPFNNGVYISRNKKLQNKYAKESIESFFNTYIEDLKKSIENPSETANEDW